MAKRASKKQKAQQSFIFNVFGLMFEMALLVGIAILLAVVVHLVM